MVNKIKEIKLNKKKILLWSFSILFILVGLNATGTYKFLLILDGIIILPPVINFLKDKSNGRVKNWMIVVIFFSLFLFGRIGFMNTNNQSITGNVVNEPQGAINQQVGQVNQNAQVKQNTVQKIKGESRNNPQLIHVPVRFTMKHGWWQEADVEINVTEVKRGGLAWQMIKKANWWNSEPSEGKEYLLTKIRIKVFWTEDNEPYVVSTSNFKMVSGKGAVYEDPSIVEPQPKLGGEIYPGGVIDGWIAFEVDKTDILPLLRIEGVGDNNLWFRIDATSQDAELKQEVELSKGTKNSNEEKTKDSEKDVKKDTAGEKETSDWLGDLQESLKDLSDGLEEQSQISEKIGECTELCAGENIDIPVVKDECRSSCYQIYYYTGEESLDEYIAGLKK